MKITRRKLIRIIKEEHRRLLEVEATPEKDKAYDLISAVGNFTPAQVLDLLYYVIQDIKSADMADEEAYKKVSKHLTKSTGTVLEPETHPLDTDRDGNVDYSEIESTGMVFGMPPASEMARPADDDDGMAPLDVAGSDRAEMVDIVASEIYDTMDSSSLNKGWFDSLVEDLITMGELDGEMWYASDIEYEDVKDRVIEIEEENQDLQGL